MKKKEFDVLVVGGGASGIVAAIAASRAGARVVLCEKMPMLGRKVRASGNGRCNLSNERLDPSFYNENASALVWAIFSRFGQKHILDFFRELGLRVYSEKGRLFPVTNQSVSVLEVLELELSRRKIEIFFDHPVEALESSGSFFEARSRRDLLRARRVILCGGGRSYPAYGADGNAYALARAFGHTLVDPVPSVVPLEAKDPWCHFLQGQRIRGVVRPVIQGQTGPSVEGEFLFTQYGFSGTAVLDASEPISIALNRTPKQTAAIEVDFLPFLSEKELLAEINARLGCVPLNQLLAGLLPPKFMALISREMKHPDAQALVRLLKRKSFAIRSTRGWNEAEFTAGGISLAEVEPTLESKKRAGLFFAGEILDVQGRRGGYNLAWAWASGWVAGAEAGKR